MPPSGFGFGAEPYQIRVLLAPQAFRSDAFVARTVEQTFIVRTDVEAHWKALGRVHAANAAVEENFAFADAHASGAQVAEPEDALAVGHDDHL